MPFFYTDPAVASENEVLEVAFRRAFLGSGRLWEISRLLGSEEDALDLCRSAGMYEIADDLIRKHKEKGHMVSAELKVLSPARWVFGHPQKKFADEAERELTAQGKELVGVLVSPAEQVAIMAFAKKFPPRDVWAALALYEHLFFHEKSFANLIVGTRQRV